MLRAFLTCCVLLMLLPLPSQARDARARPERGPEPREARPDFRGMREELREQNRRDPERWGGPGRDGPPLRRLDPAEREQLRRDVRDAGREHYRR